MTEPSGAPPSDAAERRHGQPATSLSPRRCCTALRQRKHLKTVLWPVLALLCCICLDVAASAILASAMPRPSLILLVIRLITLLVAPVVAVQLGIGAWTCRCSQARSINAEAPLAVPLAACDGSSSAPASQSSSMISTETAGEQELQRLRSNFARLEANSWKKSSVIALCFLATTAQSIYIGTWVLAKEQYSALTDYSLMAVIILMNVEFALMMKIVSSLTEEEGFLVSALHPHPLKFREVNTYLNCGVCGQGIGRQTGGNYSFHCSPCQFDACLGCIGEVRKRGNEAGSIRRSDKGLKPAEDMSTAQYFKRLLQLVRPFKWLVLFACLCVAIAQSAAVTMPYLQGEIVNILIKGDAKSFRDTLMIFLVVACLAAIFQGLQGLGGSLVQRKINFATSAQILSNLLRQDIAFFDGAMTGQLTSSMTSDLDMMVDPIQSFMTGFLASFCTFLGGTAMCLLTSWRLTVLTATLLCPVIYMLHLYGPYCFRVWLGQHHNMREADAVAVQAFRNIRTIRAFAAMATEELIYNRYVDQAHSVGAKAALVVTGYSGIVHSSKYVALVLMFWYGGQQWLHARDGEEPEFNIGQLLTYNLYWIMVSNGIGGMIGIFGSFIRAASASRRVFTLLDLEPDIPLDNGLALGNEPCLVEFRDVHFTYQMRPTQKVLKGVSFILDPGTSVAFVGRSGAGKSTLVNLILRFYDPQEGCVMLNGRPLPDWNLRQHHRRVSVVTQETQIFNRSIRDNLTYGLEAENITADVVVTAAKQANAHEFIADMDMGYKSMTGEGGSLLSGGQKQRLAIARALLRNPSLLLLDEATSALDAESEGLVQGALEAMMRDMVGKTSILLIAHRLSTVISSNKIVVMDSGSVAEQGKHSDLLQQDGAYAALVSSQLLASGRKTTSEDGAPLKDRAALEPNLTGGEETSEKSAAGSASGSALGDEDAQSAEAVEDAGSPASVKKGSEPLLTLKERTEAGSVALAPRQSGGAEAAAFSAAPQMPGSCRACLKYRGRVLLLIMLIVLDYAASISLDLGTKQVVYLVLCSSRLALVILGMFFGVQLGLGLLCGGMQDDDRPLFGIHRAEDPSSSALLSSQCCQPAVAGGLSRGSDSSSSGSCDSLPTLGDSGQPVHDRQKSASGNGRSVSSQSTSDGARHEASPTVGRIEEVDARLKRMHEGLEAKEQHLWKRNLVLASCGVLVTAQSIYCSAHVVNSEGLTLWEAIALLVVIVSMNAQFFVVKNVVDALTEDEGMLIKALHLHRLVYQTNAQGARCSVCSEKLGPKTGGLACLACRTCDFNFRACTNCYRKQQVLGGGGHDCSLRSDKGPRPSLELSSLQFVLRMLRVMKPLRCAITSLVVTVLLEQVGNVALPACGGRIFDVLLGHEEDLYWSVLKIYAATAAAASFFHLLSLLSGQYVGQGLYFHMRKLIFDSLLRQDMAFFDSATTGNLTTRMTSDLLHMVTPVTGMLTSVLPNVMLLIGGTFMCFSTSWEMTVLCCAMVGPVMYVTRLYAQYGTKLYTKIMAAKADANSVASESLKNVRIVRAYAADHVEMMNFDKHIDVASRTALQAAWCDAGVSVLSGLKDFGTLVVILWFGGLTILSTSWSGFQPQLTKGQLVTYNLFWTMMTNAAQTINGSLNNLIQANSAATRVFEIIDFVSDIELEVGMPLPSGPLEIAFQDVHFTYQMRPDKRVLNGLSFKIRAGESVAIVGRSGSGKSTLVNMIMRYYDPQGGQIIANGQPLPEWHLLKYVRRVGVVTQETQVFCRSIWENLVYGLENGTTEAEEVDESKVVAAAEKANIHSFIVGLDEGYKSRVGEGGVNLSGGQKQRLAIARALLRSPSLLLLDEATSALDAVNEALVQEALEGMVQAMAGNCSVMLIAHRLSTVVKSDNILVMDKGEAVESGKHEQLLTNAGVYAQLVQRQVAAHANTLEE